MTFLYFWIAAALLFLVVEFWTSTFYGLALSLAAGIVALYVFFSGAMELSIVQGIIFAVASLILAYTLPRVLSSSSPDVPQGFDRYIGEKRTVKKSAGELKISLDGVEYIVDTDEDIVAGDKVEIVGHKGTGMKVRKAK